MSSAAPDPGGEPGTAAFPPPVLYELVRRGGRVSGPEIHEPYASVRDEFYHGRELTPIGERSRRNKLHKLEDYVLLDWESEIKHREYRVHDQTLQSLVVLTLPHKPSQ